MNGCLTIQYWLLALICLVTTSACTDVSEGSRDGAAKGNVHIQAVLTSDPTKITHVVIASASFPGISQSLVQDGANGWAGILSVPVGEQIFTAQAYDTTNEVIYVGKVFKEVGIADNSTVSIVLQPRGATATGNSNSAVPVITYLTSTMDEAGLVHLTAGIADSITSGALTYEWSLPAGGISGFFTNPDVQDVEWHPPVTDEMVKLTLTVRNDMGLTDTASINVRSVAIDTTPDNFSFVTQTDVALDTQVVSNEVTIAGINDAAIIAVARGSYSLDGGNTFTSAVGTVSNNQKVFVRGTSANTLDTDTMVTLFVGGVTGTFTIHSIVVPQ